MIEIKYSMFVGNLSNSDLKLLLEDGGMDGHGTRNDLISRFRGMPLDISKDSHKVVLIMNKYDIFDFRMLYSFIERGFDTNFIEGVAKVLHYVRYNKNI